MKGEQNYDHRNLNNADGSGWMLNNEQWDNNWFPFVVSHGWDEGWNEIDVNLCVV